MNDLISRKAAIDSIEKHLRFGDELYPLTDTDKVLNHAFSIAASCVYNLPSAQPEIIRCKDCKHHWTYKCMDSMPIERCDLEQTFYDSEHDFCSLAERREVTE